MSMSLQETEVSCNGGRFIINERLVRRIIESYYRARANIQFGKAKENELMERVIHYMRLGCSMYD